MSLLQIVTENHDTFRQFQDFVDATTSSDFFEGLGTVFGQAITAIGHGGSELLQAAGHGLHDGLNGLGDFTSKVTRGLSTSAGTLLVSGGHAVRDVEHGTTNLFSKIFGGIGGAVLWAVFLVVLATIAYIYFRRTPSCFRNKPTVGETTAPPPSPLPLCEDCDLPLAQLLPSSDHPEMSTTRDL